MLSALCENLRPEAQDYMSRLVEEIRFESFVQDKVILARVALPIARRALELYDFKFSAREFIDLIWVEYQRFGQIMQEIHRKHKDPEAEMMASLAICFIAMYRENFEPV